MKVLLLAAIALASVSAFAGIEDSPAFGATYENRKTNETIKMVSADVESITGKQTFFSIVKTSGEKSVILEGKVLTIHDVSEMGKVEKAAPKKNGFVKVITWPIKAIGNLLHLDGSRNRAARVEKVLNHESDSSLVYETITISDKNFKALTADLQEMLK